MSKRKTPVKPQEELAKVSPLQEEAEAASPEVPRASASPVKPKKVTPGLPPFENFQGDPKFFPFPEELKEARLLRKDYRFVATVEVEGKQERCFLPATVSIGDFYLEDLPCLVAANKPGGKTSYTVKALSVDEGESWIGIDLNASNRYVEYFARTGALESLVGTFKELKREQALGSSRLDFKIDDLWLEVKTPVDTLHRLNGPSVRLREEDNRLVPKETTVTQEVERKQVLNPGRMEKQVKDMMEALKAGERAALLTVHQYVPNTKRPYRQSTKKQTIGETLAAAYEAGLESWKLDLEVTASGVRLHELTPTRIKR